MKIKMVIDDGCFLPQKAHKTDAGFDLRSPSDFTVPARGACSIDTGIHLAIPEGYVGFLKSKSGLNVKHGITCEGVIDSGYTGSIVAKLYNNSNLPYRFEKGDKITQIVILPIPDVDLVYAVSLEETDRGDNGFGSSGR